MTSSEIELLIPQWGAPAGRPILADPWDRPWDQLRQQAATTASLKDRPDFGWALAECLATAGRTCTLLKRPEYRWIRAALQILTGGESSTRRLREHAVVSLARDIHDSDRMRPLIKAVLMTRDATVASVAGALRLDAAVVEAYDSLFFNITDRKSDLAYVRNLLGAGDSSPLMVSRDANPSDEEVLLSVGFNGTIEDVLKHAGCVAKAGGESIDELSDRLLRDVLAAGADWVGSPNSRRQAPPAMVAYAINLARNVRAEPAEDLPLDSGASIGSILSEQFKKDANQVRLWVEQRENIGPT